MNNDMNKVVILAIGDEVLEGDVINSNAAFIAHELISLGFEILYHKTVGDYDGPVKDTFKEAISLADIVITSGGLGPTKDDMTKKAIADAMGLPLVFDESIKELIASYFKSINASSHMSDNNLSQCYIPEGGQALPNNHGTAPGVYVETKDHKVVIMLPGPPRELNPMFTDYVVDLIAPRVSKRFFEKYYMISGIGEAPMEDLLRKSIPESESYKFNTYLTQSGVLVKVTGWGKDESDAEAIVASYDPTLKEVLSQYLYSEVKKEIWEVVSKILLEKNLTISTAESFTGGLIGELLTRMPGISKVYLGSVTAYSKEAKEGILGVPADTIEAYGTVSEATAAAMAQQCAKLFKTDVAIATTGVAGPSEEEGKPVGTCYLAVYYKGETKVTEAKFRGDRASIKNSGANRAFHTLFTLLKG